MSASSNALGSVNSQTKNYVPNWRKNGVLVNRSSVVDLTGKDEKSSCNGSKAGKIIGLIATIALIIIGALALIGLGMFTAGSTFPLAGIMGVVASKIAFGGMAFVPAWILASAVTVGGLIGTGCLTEQLLDDAAEAPEASQTGLKKSTSTPFVPTSATQLHGSFQVPANVVPQTLPITARQTIPVTAAPSGASAAQSSGSVQVPANRLSFSATHLTPAPAASKAPSSQAAIPSSPYTPSIPALVRQPSNGSGGQPTHVTGGQPTHVTGGQPSQPTGRLNPAQMQIRGAMDEVKMAEDTVKLCEDSFSKSPLNHAKAIQAEKRLTQDLEEAEAEFKEKSLTLDSAKGAVSTCKANLKSKLVTKADYDAAQTALKEAQEEYDSAKEVAETCAQELDKAKEATAKALEQCHNDEIAVFNAKKALEDAKSMLEMALNRSYTMQPPAPLSLGAQQYLQSQQKQAAAPAKASKKPASAKGVSFAASAPPLAATAAKVSHVTSKGGNAQTTTAAPSVVISGTYSATAVAATTLTTPPPASKKAGKGQGSQPSLASSRQQSGQQQAPLSMPPNSGHLQALAPSTQLLQSIAGLTATTPPTPSPSAALPTPVVTSSPGAGSLSKLLTKNRRSAVTTSTAPSVTASGKPQTQAVSLNQASGSSNVSPQASTNVNQAATKVAAAALQTMAQIVSPSPVVSASQVMPPKPPKRSMSPSSPTSPVPGHLSEASDDESEPSTPPPPPPPVVAPAARTQPPKSVQPPQKKNKTAAAVTAATPSVTSASAGLAPIASTPLTASTPSASPKQRLPGSGAVAKPRPPSTSPTPADEDEEQQAPAVITNKPSPTSVIQPPPPPSPTSAIQPPPPPSYPPPQSTIQTFIRPKKQSKTTSAAASAAPSASPAAPAAPVVSAPTAAQVDSDDDEAPSSNSSTMTTSTTQSFVPLPEDLE